MLTERTASRDEWDLFSVFPTVATTVIPGPNGSPRSPSGRPFLDTDNVFGQASDMVNNFELAGDEVCMERSALSKSELDRVAGL
jgi:hypothetical protein